MQQAVDFFQLCSERDKQLIDLLKGAKYLKWNKISIILFNTEILPGTAVRY